MKRQPNVAKEIREGSFICNANSAASFQFYQAFGFAVDGVGVPVSMIESNGPDCLIVSRPLVRGRLFALRVRDGSEILIQVFDPDNDSEIWEPVGQLRFRAVTVRHLPDAWQEVGKTGMQLEQIEIRGIETLGEVSGKSTLDSDK